MRTWPILNDKGSVTAFEVDMVLIGLNEIEKLLNSIPEVSRLTRRRIFSATKEIHIAFAYRGDDYVVWEPFGDNSRYWIGPKNDPVQTSNAADLEKVFRDYKPSLFKRIFN